MAPSLVSADVEQLAAFSVEHGDVVLKPLVAGRPKLCAAMGMLPG